ncbi:hypothetical protein [Thermotoga sp. KOL6]|uniref:hypothetical protein n=1 Tax=Thermotoga sp. KOL6 TaxID=126741 RepID=UPI000C75E8D4|nr:hypothetical protein [Thermotoga sp. KOL6]PLV60105.1 hypothetical protein AS005_02105 [Thermotoga sp. KOL6]
MRILLIVLVISGTVFSSPILLLFQNQAILMNHVKVNGIETFPLPHDWSVMDVLGAESWYTEPGEKVDWEEIVKGRLVEIADTPPDKCEVVSLSPIILKKGTKHYFYNTSLRKWLVFDYSQTRNVEAKLVVKARGEVTVLLQSNGSWKAEYYLFERNLIGNVFLNISNVEKADVFLVSRPMTEEGGRVMFAKSNLVGESFHEEFETNEVKIFHVGEVEDIKKPLTVEFISTSISNIDEYYFYSFGVNEGSFGFQKSTFMKKFKTPTDLPGGTVNVVSKVSGVDLIIGKTQISDIAKDAEIELPIASSWDVRVRGELVEEREYKDLHERSWRVIVQNLKKREVKAKVIIHGRELEIVKSSLKPSKVMSDMIVFELNVPSSSEKTFEFTVKSRW